MKKRAFTLAELLISLCIIGVLVAILAPQLANLRPNKDKLLVMKYYNVIQDTIGNLLLDSAIYLDGSDSAGTCVGLACTTAPALDGYTDCEKTSKLQCLLKKELSLSNETIPKGYNFVLAPGVYCYVSTGTSSYTIKIKIGTDSENRDFNSNKKVNAYQYQIDNYGRIILSNSNTDKLMRVYLQNPTKLNTLKEDIALAKTLK